MYIKIKFNLKVCMVSKYDDEDEDFDLCLAKSIRSLTTRIQIRSWTLQVYSPLAVQTKWNSNQLMMTMIVIWLEVLY